MSKIFKVPFFLILLSPCISIAQDTLHYPMFTDLEEALLKPELVYNLDLSDKDLHFSWAVFQKFPNLEYLSLKNDHLRQIPVEIASLKNLRILDLSGNDFDELPEGFAKLTSLEELYLNDDPNLNLSSIFNQLSGLPRLKSLHLEHDRLRELPADVTKLKNLEYLYLNENNFKMIPFDIDQFDHLKLVDVHDNPINKDVIKTYEQKREPIVRF